MSINYVYKVKKGIHKVIYDKLYFNCSTFRKMHYEVSITSDDYAKGPSVSWVANKGKYKNDRA